MKISICSDIHLEFGTISLDNTDDADVLILSGDICTANDLTNHDPFDILPHTRGAKYHTFFQECSARFPTVLYVAGNHEHYHGDFIKTNLHLKEKLAYLKNVHVMDKSVLSFNDVTFIGGTLWTDMNKEDPHTLLSIRGYMNDFKIIDHGERVKHYRDADGNSHETKSKLLPEDTVQAHKEMVALVEQTVANKVSEKFVVIGHHAPSKQSTHPRYKEEVLVNGAYSSDLSDFILDRPQIKLWTHGHTHEGFDYNIGSTRIVCNPRGYDGYEPQADLFKLKTVEI